MVAKREMQLVRLACKWRWLTAEEGEDVLFLKRKFGDKLSVEEIMRRRGYLDAHEIDELREGVDSAGPRSSEPRPDPRFESRDHTILNAQTAFIQNPLATIMGRSPLADPTLFGMQRPVLEPDEDDEDSEPELVGPQSQANEERTIIAPLPEAVLAARLKQRLDDREGPTSTELDRDELLENARVMPVYDEEEEEEEEDDDDQERTMYDPRPIAPSVLRESAADSPLPAAIRAGLRSSSRAEEAAPIELPLDALQPYEPDHERPPIGFTPDDDEEHEEEWGSKSVSLLMHVDDLQFAADPLASIVLSEPLDGADTQDAYQLDPLDTGAETPESLLGLFGGYRLEHVIARGVRCVVYRAKHLESGFPLGVKVLTGDSRQCAQFIAERGEEMLAAAPIVSGNIVRILDVGRVESRYYVALDYIDGWTLAEKLTVDERPPPLEALSIGRDVARALADAEAQGVSHRDVRPGNVLIAPDRAYLTGFGFAKVTEDGITGSAGFIAPERFEGTPPYFATDLYSLGVLLYRLLTGDMPFAGENARAIAAAAAALVPQDVRVYQPSLPAPVAELVQRLLSRDPTVRGPSCAAVAETLDQLVFDLDAAGLLAADVGEPPPIKPLAIRTGLIGGGALVVSVALPAIGFAVGDISALLLDTAFLGALLSIVATLLLATVALIRRGQVPLPMSSAWLVRVEEGAGALGTAFLVAGLVIAPPAILNLFVSFLAGIVLVSWVFGVLLRRAIAAAREDGGVGRMLAVLGDPSLARWRFIHAPLLSALTCLATVRFMLLAYFSAS